MKFVKAEEAVSVIQSGNRIFVHGVAATPHRLIDGMMARASELRDVELVHIHTEGGAPYAKPEFAASFKTNVFFVGGNIREAVQNHRADYVPVFLSEIPALFRKKILPIDVAMIHVSPPDNHGYCSLGVSVDIARAAVQCAGKIIAQVNPAMPRTHGESMVHVSQIHALIDANDALPEVAPTEPDEIELAIGKHVAGLVEDGATLQMGIGAIPNAVLSCLTGHKKLGIHT
ncbi:MAG TPA: 4-hydroxybutyrate CoA-transferase, partial [Leptospiraceae bacterium]|nr:4-hydroxybutyrate CoA-transferase [Leptospiraceae bacterium]